VTTPTPAVPLDDPRPAPAQDRPAREVVVGVDGSEVGLSAVRWAAREAVRRGAPLRLLHAAPYLKHRRTRGARPPELSAARRIAAAAYTVARHTDHDLQTTTEIVTDDPTTALLRAAGDSQLLVLGSSATGAADELVLASVAVHVASRSPLPVIVVPRQRPDGADTRAVVAVLGVGDQADDEAVAAFAAEAAERFGVGLTMLQTRSPRHSVAGGWADDPEEWRRRHPDLEVAHKNLPSARPDQLLGATCPTPLLAISAGRGSLLHRNLDGPHLWLLRHCTSPMALVPKVHRREQEPREEIVARG
jgi:nucleotide-binding universal stress UspA family protein